MRFSEILPYVSPGAVHAVAFNAARGRELSTFDWMLLAVFGVVAGCCAFVAFRKYIDERARFAAIPRMQPRPVLTEPYVWVNTRTRVYFNEGHRWYKRTREGAMVRLSVAIASGCRAARV